MSDKFQGQVLAWGSVANVTDVPISGMYEAGSGLDFDRHVRSNLIELCLYKYNVSALSGGTIDLALYGRAGGQEVKIAEKTGIAAAGNGMLPHLQSDGAAYANNPLIMPSLRPEFLRITPSVPGTDTSSGGIYVAAQNPHRTGGESFVGTLLDYSTPISGAAAFLPINNDLLSRFTRSEMFRWSAFWAEVTYPVVSPASTVDISVIGAFNDTAQTRMNMASARITNPATTARLVYQDATSSVILFASWSSYAPLPNVHPCKRPLYIRVLASGGTVDTVKIYAAMGN